MCVCERFMIIKLTNVVWKKILEGYKSMLPKEQWQQVWNNLPQEPQRSLSQRYNLML